MLLNEFIPLQLLKMDICIHRQHFPEVMRLPLTKSKIQLLLKLQTKQDKM